jgi:hypothetical protein
MFRGDVPASERVGGKSMKWPLVLALSGFGLVMGIATVFVIPPNLEPLFWLAIFVVCAVVIARVATGRFFLHGLLVSLVNSIWITTAHVIFFDTYLANHPQEAAMSASMPLGDHPKLLMTIMGPIIGAVSGVVLGLFAVVAAWLLGRRAHRV